MVIVRSGTQGHRRSCAGGRMGRRRERSHRRRPRKPITVESGRVFFSGPTPQQVRSPRAVDWLAGAATLLALIFWGALISLLAN